MANFISSDFPLFIPKIMDGAILNGDFGLKAALMDLDHAKWRPGVASSIAKSDLILIVDPVILKALFPNARAKSGFQKISYGADIEPEGLYSNQADRENKVIDPAIKSQLSCGAEVLIAPYFYSEDTEDVKFSLNLTLLSETIRYLEDKKISLPLYASISLGSNVLTRNLTRNLITDMYCSKQLKDKLAGYFIYFNEFDARKADLDKLIGVADLVFQLSKEKPVFVRHVGGFGDVLCALGASGLSSGINSGESFSTKNFEPRKKGFGRDGEWTYVPEIFNHVNDQELEKIGYVCSCKYCNGSLPKGAVAEKSHFLETRPRLLKSLVGLKREEKVKKVKESIEKATRLINEAIRDHSVTLKGDYLERWKTVLEAGASWEHLSTDDESALLKELDNGWL